MAVDVGNAYLHAYTKEKLYTIARPEFGELEGRVLIIVKALYGLKTSMSRWHEALSDKLRLLNFKSCKADPDLWIRDAGDHYEYIAVYSDDLLVFSKHPSVILKGLSTLFPIKGGKPEFYLGGDVEAVKDEDGVFHYVCSAKTYIKNVCDKIEKLYETSLRNHGSPLPDGYHPEIDTSPLLVGSEVSKYSMLIGSLNWAVMLGRFDVHYTASTMGRYQIAPCEGHLEHVFSIFGYLKHHRKHRLFFDSSK